MGGDLNNARKKASGFFKNEQAKARYMAAYDAVLSKWPVAYEEIQVPTSLGSTHIIASGAKDAPPLVLLHAALATAVVWRSNVEALSRHFRVYAVDVIGQSGKSIANSAIKTRDDFAAWMNELFDALGIERASLVGSSYGGFLALNQALHAPERVERVVLVSPGGVFASFAPHIRKALFRAFWGAVQGLFGIKREKPDLTVMLGGKGMFTPEDEDWLVLGRQLMDGSVRINAIMPAVFSKAELEAIAAPTLLLIADHEMLYDPHAILLRAKARMPGLEGEIIPDAHHLAAMAQPEAVNARIITFCLARSQHDAAS